MPASFTLWASLHQSQAVSLTQWRLSYSAFQLRCRRITVSVGYHRNH